MGKSQNSETIQRLVLKDGQEMFDTSKGYLTYEEMYNHLHGGWSFVVESGEGKDKQERALTADTQGHVIFNDTQQEIRQTMQVEQLSEKEQEKVDKEIEKQEEKEAKAEEKEKKNGKK